MQRIKRWLWLSQERRLGINKKKWVKAHEKTAQQSGFFVGTPKPLALFKGMCYIHLRLVYFNPTDDGVYRPPPSALIVLFHRLRVDSVLIVRLPLRMIDLHTKSFFYPKNLRIKASYCILPLAEILFLTCCSLGNKALLHQRLGLQRFLPAAGFFITKKLAIYGKLWHYLDRFVLF